MQILSVALQNFKTHQDRFFEFQPGINAICGENGAGKTSILEAIAWVLFNYQGDYAREDLIRNGSGSAQVTVTFVSNWDSRTYQVQRCTQRGYGLFDPQLNERLPYSRLKDEVLPWLRQHLGVGAGTNLAQLFARTVGVPQGTLTADFLQPAEQRKAVFDAVLKVEDYKLAFKQMNSLRRYAEDQVEAVKGQISQYEEALLPWDDLTQKHQTLREEIGATEQRLQTLTVDLTTLEEQRQQLKAEADRLQSLNQDRQGLMHQISASQAHQERLHQVLSQAAAAVSQCQLHQLAYQAYQAADQTLQQLGQQQQQRQALQQQYQTLQVSQGQKKAELARLQSQMETFAATLADLEQLRPQVAVQEELEVQLKQYQQQLDQFQALTLQQHQAQVELQRLGQQQQQLQQSLDRLDQLTLAVAAKANLEVDRDRCQQHLSRLTTARQFEADLRTLVQRSQQHWTQQQAETDRLVTDLTQLLANLPPVSTACLEQLKLSLASTTTIQADLMAELQAILKDLADQTDAAELKQQLKTLEQELQQRYAWQAELTQQPLLTAQQQQIQQQQEDLHHTCRHCQAQLAGRSAVEAQVQSLTQQIEGLGRPREKSQILQRTLQNQSQLEAQRQAAHSRLQAEQTALEQQLETLTQQLQEFAHLDSAIATQQEQRRQSQPGHDLYLQNQALANQRPQLQADLTTAQTALAALQAQQATLESTYQQALAQFDPVAAANLETSYSQARSEADRLTGSLPQQQQRLVDIQQQLTGLGVIKERRQQALADLQRRERVKRFINFARKAYNEAGPRITEQYLRNISYHADQLFRELLNRPNVALQWTRDYEILVQEGPHQRRFTNLSGGEQMCAALAVRLALLKVLADLNDILGNFLKGVVMTDHKQLFKVSNAANGFRQSFPARPVHIGGGLIEKG
ncbi:MAG: AAA family ATPase, partial [Nodosilinea sp.]